MKLFYISLIFFIFLGAGKVIASDRGAMIKGLNTTAKNGLLADPSNPPAGLPILTGQIIGIVLGFLGVIFLVLTIYGGFLWMTAQGNDDQIEKAKNIISSAVLGLVLVLAAYAITNYVISKAGNIVG